MNEKSVKRAHQEMEKVAEQITVGGSNAIEKWGAPQLINRS